MSMICCSTIGSLSKDVFERSTSTGSEAFSLFIYLGANKFVLLSFFSLIKTIYQRVSTKPLPNDAKSPLPVDVRRSKTPLLKLPNSTQLISAQESPQLKISFDFVHKICLAFIQPYTSTNRPNTPVSTSVEKDPKRRTFS